MDIVSPPPQKKKKKNYRKYISFQPTVQSFKYIIDISSKPLKLEWLNKILVSSANKTGVDLSLITLAKSLIYMRKKQRSKDEALWNSPPSSAKVKNGQSCTLLPPVWLHGLGRSNFIFVSFSNRIRRQQPSVPYKFLVVTLNLYFVRRPGDARIKRLHITVCLHIQLFPCLIQHKRERRYSSKHI